MTTAFKVGEKSNPSDNIQHWEIDRLIPYAKNSRTHSPEQVAQIAASIKEWGFTSPILIDETGSILAGHGRLAAARKLGLDTLPVMVAEGWTDAQKRAYVIADNKLALNAGWDMDMLKVEISGLSDLNFDLELLGFDDIELATMFDENPEDEEKDLKEESYNEVFNIIIECKDEAEQEKIFNRLDSEGYKCRVQSL